MNGYLLFTGILFIGVFGILSLMGYILAPIIWLMDGTGVDAVAVIVMYLLPAMLFAFRYKKGTADAESPAVFFGALGLVYAVLCLAGKEIMSAVAACIIVCFLNVIYHFLILKEYEKETEEEDDAEVNEEIAEPEVQEEIPEPEPEPEPEPVRQPIVFEDLLQCFLSSTWPCISFDGNKNVMKNALAGVLKAIFHKTGYSHIIPGPRYSNASYKAARKVLEEVEDVDEACRYLALVFIEAFCHKASDEDWVYITNRIKSLFRYLETVDADEADKDELYKATFGCYLEEKFREPNIILAVYCWRDEIQKACEFNDPIKVHRHFFSSAVFGVLLAIEPDKCDVLKREFIREYIRLQDKDDPGYLTFEEALEVAEEYEERYKGRNKDEILGIRNTEIIRNEIYEDMGCEPYELSLDYFDIDSILTDGDSYVNKGMNSLDAAIASIRRARTSGYSVVSTDFDSDYTEDYDCNDDFDNSSLDNGYHDDFDDYLREDEEHLEFNQTMDFFDNPDGGIDGYIESGWDYLGFGDD